MSFLFPPLWSWENRDSEELEAYQGQIAIEKQNHDLSPVSLYFNADIWVIFLKRISLENPQVLIEQLESPVDELISLGCCPECLRWQKTYAEP